MNILMVSGEALPFSKTGGLADVVTSLSEEFVKKGHHVSIVVPYYKTSNLKKSKKPEKLMDLTITMNWRRPNAEIFHVVYAGIDYFLIKNDQYFNRDGYYGYFDDGERFAFFALAAIELMKRLPFDIDICHVHDWQAGMIPCLLKEKYRNDKILGKIKTVLTIHNPLFKGFFSKDSLFDLYNLNMDIYNNGRVRFEDQVSTLKAAIAYSDKITTVSPTHSYELTTIEGSKGLWYELTLRQQDFVGILNGMNTSEFNPKKDKLISQKFSATSVEEGKLANKKAFCEANGLNPNLPLFAVVSRLSDQKGLDLIFAMADFVSNEGGNFAIVGSGEQYAEDWFKELKRRNPTHNYIFIGYSDEIAHKLYAASDFFIMPSAFEPCGLCQMIAQAYGSLPIVRRTGGLKDTVIGYDTNENNVKTANGIAFDGYSVTDAIQSCAKALLLYFNSNSALHKLRVNAMKTDHSWSTSADKYLNLYSQVLPK